MNENRNHMVKRVMSNLRLMGGQFVLVLLVGAFGGCSPSTDVATYDAVRSRLDALDAIALRGDEVATEKYAVGLLKNLARQREASTGERQQVYAALSFAMNEFSSAAFAETSDQLQTRIDTMRAMIPAR
jgi:hypothetical protein